MTPDEHARALEDKIFDDLEDLSGYAREFAPRDADKLTDRIRAAIKEALEYVPDGWRPIDTAIVGQDCLVAKVTGDSFEYIHKAHLTPSGKWAVHGIPARAIAPTHWQPLPTPPMKETK